MADRVASKGALVIMPDLLGPPPNSKESSIATNGAAAGKVSGSNYWLMKWWPVVRKRKLQYMEWYNSGKLAGAVHDFIHYRKACAVHD